MKDFFLSLILLSFFACAPSASTETNTSGPNEIAPEKPALAEDTYATVDQTQEKTPFVYVTDDGGKYHTADCRYSKTAHEIKLSQAKADGKTACGICKPSSTTGEKQIRCSANTAEGGRCKRQTTDATGKCFQHRDS